MLLQWVMTHIYTLREKGTAEMHPHVEHVLVFYNTLDCINPVATEKSNLETVKVKLSDLLYLTIVHVFVLACNIISINTYITILIHVFLILLFSVEHVSIYVVLLICQNGEYRTTKQLF
jgi:hypothetical protein